MLTTVRIRQILEEKGCTVDISCEPFGSVPGFVSFHKTGYPSRKIIKVLKRIIGVCSAPDRELVKSLEASIRELEWRKKGTSGPETGPKEDGSSR